MAKLDGIIRDDWLSGILQRDVYEIVVDEWIERVKDETCEEYKFLRELQSKYVFMYAKVPTNFVKGFHFLEILGFKLVDTNTVFDKPIGTTREFVGRCTVRRAVPEDRQSVVKVARGSFAYSRFHLDPQISDSVSNEIKAKWVDNFFSGKRADEMVVALVDGKVAAFLTLLHGGEDELTIDLIAVDEKQRRKGIASDMILYAESQSTRRRIIVGTQLANIPSGRFYEKLGFRLRESYYVFHYHNFSRDGR